MTRYDDLLKGVDPKWRPAFENFVENAQAAEGFLEYLASNPQCERAAELAIQREAESLGDLSTLLARSIAREPETVTRSIANGILIVMDEDADSQGELVSAIERKLGTKAKPRAAEFVATLADRLSR